MNIRRIIREIIEDVMKENVGPGSTDSTTASAIFMDIENRKFQSDDFTREYDPENEVFWFDNEFEKNHKGYSEKQDEMADGSDLDKEEVKSLDQDYRKLKKKMNWKKF